MNEMGPGVSARCHLRFLEDLWGIWNHLIQNPYRINKFFPCHLEAYCSPSWDPGIPKDPKNFPNTLTSLKVDLLKVDLLKRISQFSNKKPTKLPLLDFPEFP